MSISEVKNTGFISAQLIKRKKILKQQFLNVSYLVLDSNKGGQQKHYACSLINKDSKIAENLSKINHLNEIKATMQRLGLPEVKVEEFANGILQLHHPRNPRVFAELNTNDKIKIIESVVDSIKNIFE